jgi:hypothetical protein
MRRLMRIDSLATGDNWHEPYISGHDVLWETIILDLEKNPGDYEDWEREILERDSRFLDSNQTKELLNYMENWFEGRLEPDYEPY